MAGLDPNHPLVMAILQERLRQSREAFNSQQKQAQGGGSGGGWSSLLSIPVALGGAYLAKEMFGRGSGSGSDKGGSIWSNIFGSDSSSGSTAASGATQAASTGSGMGSKIPLTVQDIDLDKYNATGQAVGTGAVTNLGVTGAETGAGAPIAAGSSFGQYALPLAGAALGGYGLIDTLTGDHDKTSGGLQGAASGAALGGSIGSVVPGIGTLVGAGVGGALGGGLGVFGGKDPEHPEAAARGRVANELSESGVMSGLNKRNFNVDPAQNQIGTATGQLVGAVNPAAAIAAASAAQSPEEFAKIKSDTAGMIANKLGTSQNSAQEIRAMYDRMGGRDVVYGKINELAGSGMMPRPEADAALAAIDMIYGVRNKNAPSADQARFDAFQKGGSASPAPTPTPTPMQIGSGGSTMVNTPIPRGPMAAPPGLDPGFSITPQQLAARKGAQEPIDYRLMNLDRRFSNVFQRGGGGKQMSFVPPGRGIFQVG